MLWAWLYWPKHHTWSTTALYLSTNEGEEIMTRLEAFCCAVLLALLALLVITVPAQEPTDPHANQPSHCINVKDAPAAHKCECSKTPGDDGSGCEVEDKKCRLYCKKDHCLCVHKGCTS